MILLTSFKNLPKNIFAYSVSRWQPRGFNLPELKFLAPLDMFGRKLEGFNSHHEYRRLYKATLETRKKAIENWIKGIDSRKTFALICWCNSLQQAARGYSTIMCHTLLIGFSIAKRRKDILVTVDQDRFSNSVWKHNFSLFNPKRFKRQRSGRLI